MYDTTSSRIASPLRPLVIAVLAIAAGAAACSPSPDSAAPAAGTATPSHAEPTPDLPQAVLANGVEITLELAITPDELAQGLMFRPRLPDDRGMLLIFEQERLPSIWMMNTLVALDLVYLDSTGTVVDIVTDAQPCPAEPCPRFTPNQPAKAVLEIPAGSVDRQGIAVGDRLEFLRVPGYPVAG